ncbi:MAG: tetratricopeptide repeat protein [Treponema sp.]|nr:tetratricopeptide repeat protein [Treponema sp.]
MLLGTAALFGQSSFVRGEELFVNDKPGEALAFLEAAVAENPANIRASLYLGIVYQQLNMLDEAIVVYRHVLPRAGKDTALIAYNLGNAYYTRGIISSAEEFYTKALDADPVHAPSYLNRANVRLKQGALRDAISDYELYLSLAPLSPKRPRIEQLLASIRAEFAAAERRRIMEEARAAEEAGRKQRLLEDVAASLQSAAEETRGLSTGSEDIQGYESEFELE